MSEHTADGIEQNYACNGTIIDEADLLDTSTGMFASLNVDCMNGSTADVSSNVNDTGLVTDVS